MSWKKMAIIALASAAGAAALFLPRPTHNAAAAPATTSSSTSFTVSIVGQGGTCSSLFCYTPANLKVRQGDTVTWKNNTTVAHTVTSCSAAVCSGVGPGTGTDPAFNSGVAVGGTFALQFHGSGTYNYYCQIHGYAIMHGTIMVQPFIVKTTSLPAGTAGQAYSANLKPAGGESPYHWSIVTGKLPHGLKLSTAGHLSGTPTASGTSKFTVRVTDSSSPALTATRSLSIRIS